MANRRAQLRELITADAIDAWRRAQAGAARYFRCLSGDDAPCDSTTKGEHCPPCAAYLEARRDLDAALGLPPWEDVEDDVDLVQALEEEGGGAAAARN